MSIESRPHPHPAPNANNSNAWKNHRYPDRRSGRDFFDFSMIFVDKIVGVWYTIGMSQHPLLPVPSDKMNARAVLAPTVSEDLLNRWFAYLDVAPKSLETYRTNIRPFVRFLAANGITHPTRMDIIAYRDSLVAAGRKPTTVSSCLLVVRLLFGWLESEGVCTNIAAHVKPPRQTQEHKRDYVSADATARILAAIDTTNEPGARDYALISLLACCGLRAKEAASADVADLRTEAGDLILNVLGKYRSDKTDFVRVPGRVQAAIGRYLSFRPDRKPTDPLFVCTSNHGRGTRLSAQAVSVIAKSRMRAVGIDDPKLTCHSFRHGAATIALLQGCELEQASKFLRHLSLNTTMLYNHSIDGHHNPCAIAIESAIFKSASVAPTPAAVAM